MKLLPTLALAFLTTGSAFAASTPTPTATSGATATPAAMPARHEGDMHCAREAKEKKLTGEAQKNFIKACKAGKRAN
jgi:hypothetical protein